MKSKEKPLTQIGAYLAYVTIYVNGFVRNEVTE